MTKVVYGQKRNWAFYLIHVMTELLFANPTHKVWLKFARGNNYGYPEGVDKTNMPLQMIST